jgi:glycosyltransferase involved in cell wall biosynthesis
MLAKKIKIAFLISHLPKQGPVQVIYDIVINMDFSKFEVFIITLKKEGENSLFKQFGELPIRILTIDNIAKYNIFEFLQRLKFILKSNDINVLHSHCFKSLLLSSLLKKHIRKIHTIHIYPGIQSKAMNGFFIGSIINYVTKRLIKKNSFPVACSNDIKENLKKNDNIDVLCVPNGVRPLGRPLVSKDFFKKQLNLDTNFKYIISVGRFSKEKNFLFLVEEFLKLNLKSHKLIILGEGILYEGISDLIDDSIILPGFKTNVSDYLFASEYYVSTSLTEGMPLSVLEAMSAGLPLILSDIGPHKEIFKNAEDKNIGFVYNSSIEMDLNSKIEFILDLDYSTLSENVIYVYENSFNANKMSYEYQKLYIN